MHPGEMLCQVTLPALLSGQQIREGMLAKRLGVSQVVFHNLVVGKTGMTPSMALRLARVLDTTPEFWMNLQVAYDLWKAEAALAEQLRALKPLPKGKVR